MKKSKVFSIIYYVFVALIVVATIVVVSIEFAIVAGAKIGDKSYYLTNTNEFGYDAGTVITIEDVYFDKYDIVGYKYGNKMTIGQIEESVAKADGNYYVVSCVDGSYRIIPESAVVGKAVKSNNALGSIFTFFADNQIVFTVLPFLIAGIMCVSIVFDIFKIKSKNKKTA